MLICWCVPLAKPKFLHQTIDDHSTQIMAERRAFEKKKIRLTRRGIPTIISDGINEASSKIGSEIWRIESVAHGERLA